MAEKEPHQSETGTQAGDESIREWAEWLDHQYVAGYYTGGRMPPAVRTSPHPSRLDYLLIVTGVALMMAMYIAGPNNGVVSVLIVMALIEIGVMGIMLGVRLVRRAPERKRRRDSGKRR